LSISITTIMDGHIALFITMHPSSTPKQSTLLTALQQGARGFYRLPSTRCIAWSYLTSLTPASPTHDDLTVAGLEIYTSKAALQDQLNDTTFFQPFEKLIKDQQLCNKKETMVAWYLAAGFLARSQDRMVGNGGVVVRVHQMTCAGSGEKESVVKGLGEFAGWSRGSDSGLLTFAVFTRKKAEREVLVYVRYRDEGTMRRIEGRPEYQNIW
jgi:quinol monooxygenase YgiN